MWASMLVLIYGFNVLKVVDAMPPIFKIVEESERVNNPHFNYLSRSNSRRINPTQMQLGTDDLPENGEENDSIVSTISNIYDIYDRYSFHANQFDDDQFSSSGSELLEESNFIDHIMNTESSLLDSSLETSQFARKSLANRLYKSISNKPENENSKEIVNNQDEMGGESSKSKDAFEFVEIGPDFYMSAGMEYFYSCDIAKFPKPLNPFSEYIKDGHSLSGSPHPLRLDELVKQYIMYQSLNTSYVHISEISPPTMHTDCSCLISYLLSHYTKSMAGIVKEVNSSMKSLSSSTMSSKSKLTFSETQHLLNVQENSEAPSTGLLTYFSPYTYVKLLNPIKNAISEKVYSGYNMDETNLEFKPDSLWLKQIEGRRENGVIPEGIPRAGDYVSFITSLGIQDKIGIYTHHNYKYEDDLYKDVSSDERLKYWSSVEFKDILPGDLIAYRLGESGPQNTGHVMIVTNVSGLDSWNVARKHNSLKCSDFSYFQKAIYKCFFWTKNVNASFKDPLFGAIYGYDKDDESVPVTQWGDTDIDQGYPFNALSNEYEGTNKQEIYGYEDFVDLNGYKCQECQVVRIEVADASSVRHMQDSRTKSGGVGTGKIDVLIDSSHGYKPIASRFRSDLPWRLHTLYAVRPLNFERLIAN